MSTVLVVEDNENNLMLVRDVLQLKGYKVLEAMTGAEGLRLAAEGKPDLILMDIQLPDIDGITALARLRADSATRAIPVLAVSASVMPEEQQQITASGFEGFIAKPLNMKSFLQTIERFVGKA
ncbi:MAG: histidine kinase [Betaproteobacteria bacterium RIFCSPLOWO2_02_FULL_64_12]|nr:MAG: histidine kinase [Betaproteobacteria bacterium RIFCSPLOWO2_02_FULL_64_12]